MRRVVLVAVLLLACGGRTPDPAPVPADPTWPLAGRAPRAESPHGMVVSGHPLASAAGARVLERGGNAIDAAVAVGFALAAVLPEAGNIGGGGFLVYRDAGGDVLALDYRERAPGLASRDMFLDENGQPTEKSVIGHLAAGVPGAVAGLRAMHDRLGSLPWSDLVQPAVELARGHEVDEVRSRHLAAAAARLSRFPASASQFLPGGVPPSPGASWSQPDLAATLERIASDGAEGFYGGRTAALVVDEMRLGGGLISGSDLAEYRAVWRDPIVAEYRGYTVYSMPPPSSGGVTLALLLNMLEGYSPLPPHGSADLAHVHAEVMRRAFIDRNRHLGDPDFVEMPLERLASQEYADGLRSEIDLERATPTPPFLGGGAEGENTTHYSVVDRHGNAAAITTTINSAFGSAVTVTGAGFLLNNEMDDFAAAPGKPNQFGLVEGELNAVAPGKRMLSSMTPSVVLAPGGELELVLGSPGGPTIITTVFQVISNVLDHGTTLEAAIESPRMHHQAWPDLISFEPGSFDVATQEALRARGHELTEREGWSGDVSAVALCSGTLAGVADPRRGGAPVGAAAPEGSP
ncbi:MAG TPA: gamma-glutamyltransferase [Thermoanaerobaculia bacterium]|nr:gamma-glutamyltransferase [Thermoanaerobaculia bacterium]